MWGPIIGGLISGGLGIAGDLLDDRDDGSSHANAMHNANVALQKEFAQNGIQWRVQDAEKAGIHPLYALGGTGATYSPTNYIPGDRGPSAASSTLRRLADMGQNVTRAIYQTAPQEKREEALFKQSYVKGELENELLRSQIAQLKAQTGPGMPSNSEMPGLSGQGDGRRTANAYLNETPLTRVHSQPDRPGQDVGAIADYAYVRTPKGYAIVPSKDVKERIEDQLVPEAMWALRNQIAPFWKGLPAPDPKYYKLPPGYRSWRWSPLHQEFRPHLNP